MNIIIESYNNGGSESTVISRKVLVGAPHKGESKRGLGSSRSLALDGNYVHSK
jgi:GTP-sensing pleiotropic transcriptional regulator CodY